MQTLPLGRKQRSLYSFTVVFITGVSIEVKAEEFMYTTNEEDLIPITYEFGYDNKIVASLPADMVLCVYRNDLNGELSPSLLKEVYDESKIKRNKGSKSPKPTEPTQ